MLKSSQRTFNAASPAAAKPFFGPAALKFLNGLGRNNRREWFLPRKQEFERELREPMLSLIGRVTEEMADFAPEHVRPAQKCLMRIYRDTRFSADKRPYKSQIAAWWSAAGMEKTSGAGYYFHLSAKDVHIAAGLYMPQPEQLLAVRRFLLENHVEVRKLLKDRALRRLMEPFLGTPLSRAPKGFPKDHPAMDLLLCRQWGVIAVLPAEAATRKDLAAQVIRRFRLAAPLVEELNRPLRRAPGKKLLFGLG